MQLQGNQRKAVRLKMLDVFSSVSLETLLTDDLDLTFQKIGIVDTWPFEQQCQTLLLWAEKSGRLETLWAALRGAATAEFLVVLDGIEAEQRASAAAMRISIARGASRPCFVDKRPFVNRGALWQALRQFADGQLSDRLLFISGTPAVGKSYSSHLISHHVWTKQALAGAATDFVLLKLESFVGSDLDSSLLDTLLRARIAAAAPSQRFDDGAMAARIAKFRAELLVGSLAALGRPTWLVIDGLNAARLAPSGKELLTRLCHAIDQGECQNLWLILIGITPADLDGGLDGVVQHDVVGELAQQDLADFLMKFARELGRASDAEKIAGIAAEVSQVIPPPPAPNTPRGSGHDGWDEFRRILKDKCQDIVRGAADV